MRQTSPDWLDPARSLSVLLDVGTDNKQINSMLCVFFYVCEAVNKIRTEDKRVRENTMSSFDKSYTVQERCWYHKLPS